MENVMKKTTQLPAVVEFHGTKLLSEQLDDGTITVAMKPIVVGMGLSWQVQHRKLQEEMEKFNCHHMVMVALDGKERSMLCVPLKKLNGWLFSINPAKTRRPEVRATVELYQDECFTVLYDYWHKGAAYNPRTTASRKIESEADLWLKGANLIIKRIDLGVRLGEDLYECRVNAVHEGTRLSGVDFSHHIPLIPKHERRASAWVPGQERARDLAERFLLGLRELSPREQVRCAELKSGHLAVRMTAALKALASRKQHFYRPDLYRGLKLHPAFVRSRAPVRVAFGTGVPQPHRVWLFDLSRLEADVEVLEGGGS